MRKPNPAVGKTLDSQTLAALGAASVDDGAATAGLHANQEAVGTCAAGLGWLVCAFHDQKFLDSSVTGPASIGRKPARHSRIAASFKLLAKHG